MLPQAKSSLKRLPLALTLAQADDLIALAEQQRLALGVFYELRYATPFIQARELVHTGAIGQIIGVRIQTLIDKPTTYWQAGLSGRAASRWRGQAARAGGGVVLMNTRHAIWSCRLAIDSSRSQPRRPATPRRINSTGRSISRCCLFLIKRRALNGKQADTSRRSRV